MKLHMRLSFTSITGASPQAPKHSPSFTVKEGECFGACGDAPVMLVNNKRMCGFMSNDKIDKLVDEELR